MCRADWADEEIVSTSYGFPAAAWSRPCADCRRRIRRGEVYHRIEFGRGVLDIRTGREVVPAGDREVMEVCVHCMTARRWLQAMCSGFVYSEVCSELVEHWTG